MKFKGEPFRVVTDAKTHKQIGAFNERGIMECNDPKYIDRLKLHFQEFEEFECKRCGELFESKGLLLAHHRKVHNDGK